jgi:hypothetical protein
MRKEKYEAGSQEFKYVTTFEKFLWVKKCSPPPPHYHVPY